VSFSKTSNSTRPSDSCYFEVFEKLTRACYIQIALETMLLPILTIAATKSDTVTKTIICSDKKRHIVFISVEGYCRWKLSSGNLYTFINLTRNSTGGPILPCVINYVILYLYINSILKIIRKSCVINLLRYIFI
jgi:hypothetical protein